MNLFSFKIISMLVLLLISIAINFILLYKSDKKYFKISVVIIIFLNIVFYFLDYFLFKNLFTDYLAFNMLLSFLLSITFEDIKTNLMDTRVILGYFILFLVYRIIFLDFTIFLEGLIGFVLSLVLMLIAFFVKKNSIGIGDVETIAACGMIIGFPNIFHFLFKAFLFVFIYGIYLIITKKKNKIDEIPLAPFLLAATII